MAKTFLKLVFQLVLMTFGCLSYFDIEKFEKNPRVHKNGLILLKTRFSSTSRFCTFLKNENGWKPNIWSRPSTECQRGATIQAEGFEHIFYILELAAILV